MSEQITTADLDLLDANLRAMHEDGRPGSKAANAYVGNLVLRAPALIAAARRAERYEAALRELRELLIHADSMLSLLRHRGGIRRWGELGMPELYEVDHLIGQLRSSYERRIPATLTPEPPQRSQERAHSPEAGGGA